MFLECCFKINTIRNPPHNVQPDKPEKKITTTTAKTTTTSVNDFP